MKGLAREQDWIVGEKAGPDRHAGPIFEDYEYFHTFADIMTDIFHNASIEHKKLCIIDEVAHIGIRHIDKTQDLFRYLKGNNISVVLLNSAPQEKMRIKSASGMIEIGNEVRLLLMVYEQKQKGFFPIKIVSKYLGGGSIEQELFNFFTDNDNDAFRSLRLFKEILHEVTTEPTAHIEPIRTLSQLRTYTSDRWEIWMRQTLGGSKVDLVKTLTNLGVINADHEWFIDSIENYD